MDEENPFASKKKISWPLIIGIIAAMIAITALVLWILYSDDDTNTNTELGPLVEAQIFQFNDVQDDEQIQMRAQGKTIFFESADDQTNPSVPLQALEYISTMNQYVSTNAPVQFSQLDIGRVRLSATTLSSTTGEIGIDSANNIIILDGTPMPAAVWTYLMNLDQAVSSTSSPTFVNMNLSGTTAETVLGTDASKNVISLTLGVGLSLAGNVLSATGAIFTAGNGIDITGNIISVDYNVTNLKMTATQLNTIQDISTTSSPTFASLILTGDLDVQGTLTTIDTVNMEIKDNIIVLNNGEAGAGVTAGTSGLQIDRGSLTDYLIVYDETSGTIEAGDIGSTKPLTFREDTPNDQRVTMWDTSTSKLLTTATTTNLPEGSNLYWTQARFDTAFAAKNTDFLVEGAVNYYYSEARFNASFASKTTDALTEGVSNLYWTQARFDTAFSGKNTDDLTEGIVNFYWTQARFDTAFGLKSTTDLSEGTNLYYTDARVVIVGDSTYLRLDCTNSLTGILDFANGGDQAVFSYNGANLFRVESSGGYTSLQAYATNSWRVSGAAGSTLDEFLVLATTSNFSNDVRAANYIHGSKLSIGNAPVENNWTAANIRPESSTGFTGQTNGLLIDGSLGTQSIFSSFGIYLDVVHEPYHNTVDPISLFVSQKVGTPCKDLYGILVSDCTLSGTGSISGSQYGIYVNPSTKGSVENWSIYSNGNHRYNGTSYFYGDLGGYTAGTDVFEVRHNNNTQGIGIGYSGLYSTGTNPNVDFDIIAKGTSYINLRSSVLAMKHLSLNPTFDSSQMYWYNFDANWRTGAYNVGAVPGSQTAPYTTSIVNSFGVFHTIYDNTNALWSVGGDSFSSYFEIQGDTGYTYIRSRLGIGTTTFTEMFQVYTDTDVSGIIGRAHVGYIGTVDFAGFSHVDQDTATSFCIGQNELGQTRINAPTGQDIVFGINNVAVGFFTSSGQLSLGAYSTAAQLGVYSTTEQLRLGYDLATYSTFTVSSAGLLTVQSTGGGHAFYAAGTYPTLITGTSALRSGQFEWDNSLSTFNIQTANLDWVIRMRSNDSLWIDTDVGINIQNTFVNKAALQVSASTYSATNISWLPIFDVDVAIFQSNHPIASAIHIVNDVSSFLEFSTYANRFLGGIGYNFGPSTMDFYTGSVIRMTLNGNGRLNITSTIAEQLRLSYDASNYINFTVDSAGSAVISSDDPANNAFQISSKYLLLTDLSGTASAAIWGTDQHHSIYFRTAGSNFMDFHEFGSFRFFNNGLHPGTLRYTIEAGGAHDFHDNEIKNMGQYNAASYIVTGPIASSGAVSVDLSLKKVDDMVYCSVTTGDLLEGGNAAGVAAPLKLAAIPSTYWPTVQQFFPIVTLDGGNQIGVLAIDASGVIRIYKDGALANFPATGNAKGFKAWTIVWKV